MVVCADDFGLTHGVSDAILDLVSFARLGAVAVRPRGPAFAARADELRALDGRIGIGMLLVLAPARGEAGFAARALAGRLDRDVLVQTILRDLDLFAQRIGRMPDFVGAPGEVHTLPGVRGALLRALASRLPSGGIWLRDPRERLGTILRRGVSRPSASLRAGLATGFRGAARARGFATNEGYAGYWRRGGLSTRTLFERHVAGFSASGAARRTNAPLLVCRPGYRDDALDALDPHAQSRVEEFMYLSSTRFTDLWEALKIAPRTHPGA